MTLAVVNLGLPKSGTTTLARALRVSGLKVADHRVRGHQTEDESLKSAFIGDLLYRGYYGSGDPGYFLQDFDAITEMSLLRDGKSIWPQCDFALIAALRAHHPGVKFLASRRDAFAMSQSMLAWSNMGTSRLPDSNVPGLPAGYGTTSKERMQWIDGHYAALRQMFRDDDAFLEFDVSDPTAPDLISGFLGRDLPWWGLRNASRLPNKKTPLSEPTGEAV